MKIILVLLLLFAPYPACAETLQEAAQQLIATLDMGLLEDAVEQSGWFAGGAAELVGRLARGEMILDAQQLGRHLLNSAAGVFRSSLWRMTRLLAPAMLASCAGWLESRDGAAGKAARYAGLLMTMVFLVADLREHVSLCNQTVSRMSEWMQALFPLLIALLAAVGGASSSAFYQPAVMAAAGSMTALIQQVTMPLAVSVAVLTMTGGLSEEMRVSRLCKLLRQAACWTLGFGFTIFLGVMTVQGVTAAAVDGVSIRTAKYAMDRFIPIVGGMFADTVDTLVGCSLVVHNALGTLGLLLILGALLLPLVRVVLTLFLYRTAAALMEPVSNGPLCRAIGSYADVFQLLFVIQLSVGAMFLLLVAQLITVANWTVMLR
ncbi:MAG: stage III sporulation protein AE [Clostridia bacterium]|nr:stage III sporulation protein AE [Clostridia bacterium]